MEDKVTIPREEYIRLIKLARFVQDWYPTRYVECEHCGELHPEGCICINCEGE